jgi:hypothetical protein
MKFKNILKLNLHYYILPYKNLALSISFIYAKLMVNSIPLKAIKLKKDILNFMPESAIT